MKPKLAVRVVAEFLGTAFLVAAVVGSGIMAERLSGGNMALALLANTMATAAALMAPILTFGPISGAHFNPVVTLSDAIEGGLSWPEATLYAMAQVSGGISGAILAHGMFGLHPIFFSHQARSGPAQMLSEFIATFGLLLVIWGCSRSRPNAVPFAVACYITLPIGLPLPHRLRILQSQLRDRSVIRLPGSGRLMLCPSWLLK